MMQSYGTTEGMRGLIDSSLLKTVQNIIECRGVFGPAVLPLGKFETYVAREDLFNLFFSYQRRRDICP